MTGFKRFGAFALAGCLTLSLSLAGIAGETSSAHRDLERDLTRWVGYLASGELGGRDTFSEGLVKAADYLAAELAAAGARPAAADGTYFQTVTVDEVRATNRSRITVEVDGMRRTFEQGAGFTLPDDIGAKRTLTSRDLVFTGYGLYAPQVGHDDYADRAVAGKVAVWIGGVPSAHAAEAYGGSLATRAVYATEQRRAAASIGTAVQAAGGSCAEHGPAANCSASACGSKAGAAASCETSAKSCSAGASSKSCSAGASSCAGHGDGTFHTAARLDVAAAPRVTAGDELLELLFRGASVPYRELKRLADAGAPLPAVTFRGVSVTFDVDVRYEVVASKRSRNVVALVEGSDPRLKHTYVAFGAHFDHLGTAPAASGGAIFHGADDNASGTAALLALAKAYARGPRPLRSVLFVWHTGEERGLWGSRYFADHPTVAIDAIVAHVNLDMVGRNFQDRKENADTLFLVGSDWISSEVHAAAVDANAALGRPFALDFSMNAPSDPGLAYYRSDHYSYAVKGIPSIFITTGPHADYHAPSDTADKIDFGKLARVVEYAHAVGARLANLGRPPARDFAGPRAGILSPVRAAGAAGVSSCTQ